MKVVKCPSVQEVRGETSELKQGSNLKGFNMSCQLEDVMVLIIYPQQTF